MCTDGHYDDSKKRLAETLKISHETTKHVYNTGGSRLSWIFWEHENLSGLSIIQLIQLL